MYEDFWYNLYNIRQIAAISTWLISIAEGFIKHLRRVSIIGNGMRPYMHAHVDRQEIYDLRAINDGRDCTWVSL